MFNLMRDIVRDDRETVKNLPNLDVRTQIVIPIKVSGNKLDFKDTYPLHMCAYLGRVEMGEIFLDAGANPNMLDEKLKLLLRKGAKVDFLGGFGESALHIAVTNTHGEMARLLISEGANVNLQNQRKTTALHIALEKENINLLSLLIKHGADPNLQNEKGLSPLQIAEKSNRLDFIEVLKGNSPLLQNDDVSLVSGFSTTRINDVNPKEIFIPEQPTTPDPYSRYKNPLKVLKALNRRCFEDLPENYDHEMIQRLHNNAKFRGNTGKPKVEEIKSKPMTKAQKQKSKWTIVKAGDEQQRLREQREKENQKTLSDLERQKLLEEAELEIIESNKNTKRNRQKNKKAPPPPPKQQTTNSAPSQSQNQNHKIEKTTETKTEVKNETVDEAATKEEAQVEQKQQTQQQQTKNKNNSKKSTQTTESKPVVKGSKKEKKGEQEPNKKMIRKIPKTLKRVEYSSDEESNESSDDEIISMPSFSNKKEDSQKEETVKEELNSIANNEKQNISYSSTHSNLQPNQTQNQQQSQPSVNNEQPYSNESNPTLAMMQKFLEQQQQFFTMQLLNQQANAFMRQAQPAPAFVYPPQYSIPNMAVMPGTIPGSLPAAIPPGMPPPAAIPGMPMMQPSTIPFQMQQTAMPMPVPDSRQQMPNPALNVTSDEFSRLAQRVASIEQMLGPAMRRMNISINQPLGTCQSCQTINASSVCPKCGSSLCNGCRNIHHNQKCH